MACAAVRAPFSPTGWCPGPSSGDVQACWACGSGPRLQLCQPLPFCAQAPPSSGCAAVVALVRWPSPFLCGHSAGLSQAVGLPVFIGISLRSLFRIRNYSTNIKGSI